MQGVALRSWCFSVAVGALSAGLGACGAPPGSRGPGRPARVPRATASEGASSRVPEPAPPPPSRAARVRAVRAAVDARGHAVAASQELVLAADGVPARLHLVLEAGACYRAHAAGEPGPVTLRLVDEHGHEVARGRGARVASAGGPSGLCPRWSGSFGLEIGGPGGAAVTVLLERFDASP